MHRYYIVEGEIEKAFFRYLKENRFIAPGKIQEFNLMQRRLRRNEQFTDERNPEYICVIDTDVITGSTPDCLIKNLRKLIDKTDSRKKVQLLAQNENFEDELCCILQCTKNKLPSSVAPNLKELKDCKQKLANMRSEDYDRLLKGDPLRRIQDVYCANPTDTILEILEKSNLSDLLADRAKIFHIP